MSTGQGLADIATIGMWQDRAARRKDLCARQLQTGLASRAAIEQAKGVLAQPLPVAGLPCDVRMLGFPLTGRVGTQTCRPRFTTASATERKVALRSRA